MVVYGIGEKKTPNPFIVACDKFIYLEILKKETDQETNNTTQTRVQKPKVDKITPAVVNLITTTISDLEDDDGWAFLGEVGNLLQKKQPNFDPRNYGFQKLTPLINSISKFEIEPRKLPKSNQKLIYVRVIS